jgi:hypothetical protein
MNYSFVTHNGCDPEVLLSSYFKEKTYKQLIGEILIILLNFLTIKNSIKLSH